MTTAADKRWFAAVASLAQCMLCRTLVGPFQVCHRDYGKGMGMKTRACETACLCAECHRELTDGTRYDRYTKRALMDRAIVNTHAALAQNGTLELSR